MQHEAIMARPLSWRIYDVPHHVPATIRVPEITELSRTASSCLDGGITRTVVTIVGTFDSTHRTTFVVRKSERSKNRLLKSDITHMSIFNAYGYTSALWDGTWVKRPDTESSWLDVSALLLEYAEILAYQI